MEAEITSARQKRKEAGEQQHHPFEIFTFSPFYRYETSHRHWLRKGRRPADLESEMVTITTPAATERTQQDPLQLDTNEEECCSSTPTCQMELSLEDRAKRRNILTSVYFIWLSASESFL